MLIDEFWKIYNKKYKRFESPGFQVVGYPLSGDTGRYLCSIYVNKNGKYCIDKTIERSNTPSHCEYDSEEAAVMKVLHFCSFKTGISYSDNAKSTIKDIEE